jgi:copper(I)-binding protein
MMLMGLKQPLFGKWKVRGTLVFEKARIVAVELSALPRP